MGIRRLPRNASSVGLMDELRRAPEVRVPIVRRGTRSPRRRLSTDAAMSERFVALSFEMVKGGRGTGWPAGAG